MRILNITTSLLRSSLVRPVPTIGLTRKRKRDAYDARLPFLTATHTHTHTHTHTYTYAKEVAIATVRPIVLPLRSVKTLPTNRNKRIANFVRWHTDYHFQS